jgi:selenide,water dikinase
VSPGALGDVLCGLPPIEDPNVIVGTSTRDDAAVYRLNDETALVQSVDVFTPVVDDPYTFGQVAAANSLSDIYAMGARPIMALSVIGFPVDKLPLSDMGEILRGGIDKAREAGIEVVGGHSLEDNEPKYGLCVTGVVHPDRILRNSSARPGDVLILTKPLGSGVLAHAIKKGRATEREIREVVEVMTRLNRDACEAMVEVGASACTDVTGFGLLGHLIEMVQGSGVSARIRVSRVPVLGSVRSRVRDGIYPGGTRKNLEFFGKHLDWKEEVEEVDRLVLVDAQTSGGLLIAVPRERAEALQKGLESRGVETRAEIGEIVPSTDEPRVYVAGE